MRISKKELQEKIYTLETEKVCLRNTTDMLTKRVVELERCVNALNDFANQVAIVEYSTEMVDTPVEVEPVKAVLTKAYFIKPEAVLQVEKEEPKKKASKKKSSKK